MANRINLGKVAFVDKGSYSDAVEYARYDFVGNGRSTFYSRKDGNKGNALPTSEEEAATNEWWGFLANAEDAKKAADDVREHTPKIVDGYWATYDFEKGEYVATEYKATGRSPQISDTETWLLWDDDAQAYVDSGKSISADYELTKAKVEAVLTGEITSHTHATEIEKALADAELTDEEVDAAME